MTSVTGVLLDVWAELREKRLVPVAAAMLAALIAVPIFLIKPAEETAPPASVPTASSAKPLESIDSKALARPAEQAISDGSALDRFLSKNPFKPVRDLENEAGVLATTGDPSGAQPTNPFGGGGGAAAGGGAGSEVTGGGTTGGGTTGGDPTGGGGGGTTEPSQPDSGRETQKYTYVLDLTFTEKGKTKRHTSFERLSMLPGESNPLLVFLGVTASGNEASFLVDSTLGASGEGRCKPSPSDCGFVYLEPGQIEDFTDAQGTTYKLQIDQIRKVSVASAAKASAARAREEARAAATEPVAQTAEGPAPERRRLTLPLLSDFEISFEGQR